jgi:hypothetical protein
MFFKIVLVVLRVKILASMLTCQDGQGESKLEICLLTRIFCSYGLV